MAVANVSAIIVSLRWIDIFACGSEYLLRQHVFHARRCFGSRLTFAAAVTPAFVILAIVDSMVEVSTASELSTPLKK